MQRSIIKKSTLVIQQKPKNQFEELIEKEYQQKIKDEQKKVSMEERIQKITGKTRQKLKLKQIDKGERFNKMLEPMKGLDTFIDAKERIQKLNALNNKHLMRQLEHYNAIKKYHITEEEGMMKNLHSDKFFKELDIEQESKNQFQQNDFHLDFIKLELLNDIIKEQDLIKKKNKISIHQYIKDRNLILRAQNKIKKIHHSNQKDEKAYAEVEEFIRLNRQLNLANNNEQKDIFNENQTIQSMKKIEQNRRNKQIKENEMSELLIQNTNKLIKLAKEYGIQINEKHFFSNDSIYNQFKQRTERLIKKIEEDAKNKFDEKEKLFKASKDNKPRQKLRISSQIEQMLRQKRMIGYQSGHASTNSEEKSRRSSSQNAFSQENLPNIQYFSKTTSSLSTQINNKQKKMSDLRIDTISEEDSPLQKSPKIERKKSKCQNERTQSQPDNRQSRQIFSLKTCRDNLLTLTPRVNQSGNYFNPSDSNQQIQICENNQLQMANARKLKADYIRQVSIFNQDFDKFYEKMAQLRINLQLDRKDDQQSINKMQEEFEIMVNKHQLKQKLKQLGFSAEELDYNLHTQLLKKNKNQQTIAKQLRNGKVSKYY